MNWKIENRWHTETLLQREKELGGFDNVPKKEQQNIYMLSAPGKIGRDYSVDNAIEIEAAFHYNGSGKKAFNGSKKWPHVKLTVSFQEDEIEKRDAFVKKLQAWLEENYP